MPTSSDRPAAARQPGNRKAGPKKVATPKKAATGKTAGTHSPAGAAAARKYVEQNLREIRVRGEALTDKINQLLARLA